MHPALDFPHKYYLNLDRRTDRRERCEAIFAELGWDVTRHAAVDAQRLKSGRGFGSPGRYAHAVSTRLILRRAALAGAEAVLILEDDVVFHPLLEERLAELEVPEDWGIFYLGCQHCARPEAVSRGVVRVTAPLDTHAWIVRREHFLEVRRALRGKYWPVPEGGTIPNADLLLAEVTRRVPSYAAWPNLAWQEQDHSDLTGALYANYDVDGRQTPHRPCLQGLLAEVFGGTGHPPAVSAAKQEQAWFWPQEWRSPPEPHIQETPVVPLRDGEHVAFLFLTNDGLQHPDMWAEDRDGQEDRVAVYDHGAERKWSALAADLPAASGDVSFVQGQMELLKTALTDERNRFFIWLPEAAVPVRPLRELLRLLTLDGRCRMPIVPHDVMLQLNPDKADRAPMEGWIPPGCWYFHSPWWLLNREAAELLADGASLLECFAGTPAPEDAALGTMLYATGWPLLEKTACQNILWLRSLTDDAPEPESFHFVDPQTMGDIIGSGCFFAGNFAPGSGVEKYGLHL